MSSSEATITTGDGRELTINKVPTWRRRKSMANYIALLPYLFFALFPFYIMLITSLKSKQEINKISQSPFWATGIATENYVYLATNTGFFEHWLLNTFIVTAASTIISVSVGILAAYALARLRFRGVEVFCREKVFDRNLQMTSVFLDFSQTHSPARLDRSNGLRIDFDCRCICLGGRIFFPFAVRPCDVPLTSHHVPPIAHCSASCLRCDAVLGI